MTIEHGRFFVVTGGPGSGKSTLIDAMRELGFPATEEAGRGVIRDQVAIGGGALPWGDRQAFAELMLAWEMRSYHLAHRAAGPVLFDRGVPDVIGYLRLCRLPVPGHMMRAARLFRYDATVFIAPPWRAIYVNDAERRQDFAEACRTCEEMRKTYAALGYRLVELPLATVGERVAFIKQAIGEAG